MLCFGNQKLKLSTDIIINAWVLLESTAFTRSREFRKQIVPNARKQRWPDKRMGNRKRYERVKINLFHQCTTSKSLTCQFLETSRDPIECHQAYEDFNQLHHIRPFGRTEKVNTINLQTCFTRSRVR